METYKGQSIGRIWDHIIQLAKNDQGVIDVLRAKFLYNILVYDSNKARDTITQNVSRLYKK